MDDDVIGTKYKRCTSRYRDELPLFCQSARLRDMDFNSGQLDVVVDAAAYHFVIICTLKALGVHESKSFFDPSSCVTKTFRSWHAPFQDTATSLVTDMINANYRYAWIKQLAVIFPIPKSARAFRGGLVRNQAIIFTGWTPRLLPR